MDGKKVVPFKRKFFKKRFVKNSLKFQKRHALGMQEHAFKRTWTTSNVLPGSTTAPYLGSFQFHLNDLPSFNEFTSLFEQYQITGVKLRAFQPYQNGAGNTATASTASAVQVREKLLLRLLLPLYRCLFCGCILVLIQMMTLSSQLRLCSRMEPIVCKR